MGTLHIIGDIHGHSKKLIALLQKHNLVDNNLAWSGGDATLCLLGDYVDRGPDGIGTIELIMRLQTEAADAGGEVIALLGNHEVFLLAAYFFGKRSPTSGRPVGVYVDDWSAVGGVRSDLERLTYEHVEWLVMLPAMARLDDLLLIHADSLVYPFYGGVVQAVNDNITAVLLNTREDEWNELSRLFMRRSAFRGHGAIAQAKEFLESYGGERIVHGHSPISQMTGDAPEDVTAPLVYANGLCVNVDAGLYLGSEGFVYQP